MKKPQTLIILVMLYSASSYSEEITLPIDSSYNSAVAWSPDSSKIAVGAHGAIFIIDASSGEITKTIARERFAKGAKGPGDIFDIDWSPDGRKLAVCRMDVPTVHYPEDIWIIELNDETVEKITNSELYKTVAEDDHSVTLRSVYYESPKWSPDGLFLVLTVETRDRIEYKDDGDSGGGITVMVATLNVETKDINTVTARCCPEWSKDRRKLIVSESHSSGPDYAVDYDEASQRLLPDTETLITPEQRQWLLDVDNENLNKNPNISSEDQYLSPDGEKLIIKISTSQDHYGFVLKKQ